MQSEPQTQIERIAVQVEMLRHVKPVKQITNEDFKLITLRAEDLIKKLNLDPGELPDEWVKK